MLDLIWVGSDSIQLGLGDLFSPRICEIFILTQANTILLLYLGFGSALELQQELMKVGILLLNLCLGPGICNVNSLALLVNQTQLGGTNESNSSHAHRLNVPTWLMGDSSLFGDEPRAEQSSSLTSWLVKAHEQSSWASS